MRRTFAALVSLSLFVSSVAAAAPPHVILEDGGVKFTLYKADATHGFYRGTRFDHAGVFGHVEFAGHKIFGPWKGSHDPTNHDDIVGPCDEFGIEKALGYDDAKVGGTFLKIGVGVLERPKEEKYSFANKYKVVKPLEWKVSEVEGATIPIQIWGAEQSANGYGYRFTKVLTAHENPRRVVRSPVIRLEYVLKNTGEKRITTDFYNHNFFNVDADPIGPNYSFAFPVDVKAKDLKGKFGDLVELNDKAFRFKDKLPSGEFVMAELTGFDPKDEKHRTFEMRHKPSGVTVKVQHSYPFAKFNVWGIKTTICPEPYMAIDLKPGEEMKWSITYTFAHEKK